jgi:hypothetical protein
MTTPEWEYQSTDRLPAGVGAMLLDNGHRVVVKCSSALAVEELAPVLTRIVADYRARVCDWDRAGRVDETRALVLTA